MGGESNRRENVADDRNGVAMVSQGWGAARIADKNAHDSDHVGIQPACSGAEEFEEEERAERDEVTYAEELESFFLSTKHVEHFEGCIHGPCAMWVALVPF